MGEGGGAGVWDGGGWRCRCVGWGRTGEVRSASVWSE